MSRAAISKQMSALIRMIWTMSASHGVRYVLVNVAIRFLQCQSGFYSPHVATLTLDAVATGHTGLRRALIPYISLRAGPWHIRKL
jgi:hypothetical protein